MVPSFFIFILCIIVCSAVNILKDHHTTAYVGKYFQYDVFHKGSINLTVFEEGSSKLPSWVYFNSSTPTLDGLPTVLDQGTTTLVLVSQDANFTTSIRLTIAVIIPFYQIHSDSCGQNNVIRCKLLLAGNLYSMNAVARTSLIKSFRSFVGVEKEDILLYGKKLHPVSSKETVLAEGYVVYQAKGSAMTISWPVACGDPVHVSELSQIILHNINTGRMKAEVGYDVLQWTVVFISRTQSNNRLRRAAVATANPVPKPTIMYSDSDTPTVSSTTSGSTFLISKKSNAPTPLVSPSITSVFNEVTTTHHMDSSQSVSSTTMLSERTLVSSVTTDYLSYTSPPYTTQFPITSASVSRDASHSVSTDFKNSVSITPSESNSISLLPSASNTTVNVSTPVESYSFSVLPSASSATVNVSSSYDVIDDSKSLSLISSQGEGQSSSYIPSKNATAIPKTEPLSVNYITSSQNAINTELVSITFTVSTVTTQSLPIGPMTSLLNLTISENLSTPSTYLLSSGTLTPVLPSISSVIVLSSDSVLTTGTVLVTKLPGTLSLTELPATPTTLIMMSSSLMISETLPPVVMNSTNDLMTSSSDIPGSRNFNLSEGISPSTALLIDSTESLMASSSYVSVATSSSKNSTSEALSISTSIFFTPQLSTSAGIMNYTVNLLESSNLLLDSTESFTMSSSVLSSFDIATSETVNISTSMLISQISTPLLLINTTTELIQSTDAFSLSGTFSTPELASTVLPSVVFIANSTAVGTSSSGFPVSSVFEQSTTSVLGTSYTTTSVNDISPSSVTTPRSFMTTLGNQSSGIISSSTPPLSSVANTSPSPVSTPVITNPFGKLVAKLGEYFEYGIPTDTFFDETDGNTSQLHLSLLDNNGEYMHKDSWMLLNTITQSLYGLPVNITKNEKLFILRAANSFGRYVDLSFSVVIEVPEYKSRKSHLVSTGFDVNYTTFISSTSNVLDLFNRLNEYLGSSKTQKLGIDNLREGSVIVDFSNISEHHCQSNQDELIEKLVNLNGTVNQNFKDAMAPEYPVLFVKYQAFNICNPIPIKKVHQQPEWVVFVIPVLCVLIIVILAVCVCIYVWCRQERKSGKLLLDTKNKKQFTSIRRPTVMGSDLELDNLCDLGTEGRPPLCFDNEMAYDEVDLSPSTPPSRSVSPPNCPAPPSYGSQSDGPLYFSYFPPKNNPPPPYECPPPYPFHSKC